MKSKDDPEVRIRELESQLSAQASASALGAGAPPTYGGPFPPTYGAPFPPTPVKTALRLWWILLAVLVLVAVALAAGVALFSAHISSTPRSSISSPSSRPSVSGIGGNKTIACKNNAVSVSGVSNTIVITGHCASLTVSGVKNTITVDAADTIEASGFNNQITYHSGTPRVNNVGESNVVQQG
jgi:hypothetical protein